MSKIIINTTGVLSAVTINDLGARTFIHPTVDLDLTYEYKFEVLRDSKHLQNAINSSYVTAHDEYNNNILTLSSKTSNKIYRSFGITIDGGGVPISNGLKGFITIPFNANIYGWDIIGNTTGNCVVDLWKTTYELFPPTSADTITGNQPPTLTSQIINRNDMLTEWGATSIKNNDIIYFVVLTASTVSKIIVTIKAINT